MDFMGLALRAAVQGEAKYLPYSFSGRYDWTQQEKEFIQRAIDKHVPNRVDSMFNNWTLHKLGYEYFVASRATWTQGSITATSAKELAEKVEAYYKRYE